MSKSKIQTVVFRTPYYELSDSIYSLETANAICKDPKIEAIIDTMKAELDKLHDQLESNYIWD